MDGLARGEAIRAPKPRSGHAALTGCIGGLEAERRAITAWLRKHGLEKDVDVKSGTFLSDDADSYYYDLNLEQELHEVPPGTRCTFTARSRPYTGVVEESTSQGLIVGLDSYLGAELKEGTLSFDTTQLITRLIKQLEDMLLNSALNAFKTVEDLLCSDWTITTASSPRSASLASGLNAGQRAAVDLVRGSRFGLIWGPPGTGKTKTIATAVRTLAQQFPEDAQILVCAHTNVAVDNALLALLRQLEGSELAASILRYGKVGPTLADKDVDLDHHFDRRAQLDPELLADLTLAETTIPRASTPRREREPGKSLARRIRAVTQRTEIALNEGLLAEKDPIAAVVNRLTARANLIETACLRSARVIGTTLTKLYMQASKFTPSQFAVAIIDELSIANIPLTAVASWFAQRLIGVGDFKQLPPIVLAEDDPLASAYLGKNLFHWRDCEEELQRRRTCVMLDTQYRMAPPICETVSDLYYYGELRSDDSLQCKVLRWRPITVVDTGPSKTVTERPARSGLRNPAHAALVASVVSQLGAQGVHDVGVVTPYRAQAQAIRKALRAARARPRRGGVEVSTVHRYQGREKQVVIFDTVLAPPEQSSFLNDRRNPSLRNILNVAASRAQDALIVVADLKYLERSYSKRGALPEFVNTCIAYSDSSALLASGLRERDTLERDATTIVERVLAGGN